MGLWHWVMSSQIWHWDWKPSAAVLLFLQTSDHPRSNVWPRQIWLTGRLQITYSTVLFLSHSITGWETTQTWYPRAAGGKRGADLSTSGHAAYFSLLLIGCVNTNSREVVLLQKQWLWGFFLMNFANLLFPCLHSSYFAHSPKVRGSQTYRDSIKHGLLAFALLHSKYVF